MLPPPLQKPRYAQWENTPDQTISYGIITSTRGSPRLPRSGIPLEAPLAATRGTTQRLRPQVMNFCMELGITFPVPCTRDLDVGDPMGLVHCLAQTIFMIRTGKIRGAEDL